MKINLKKIVVPLIVFILCAFVGYCLLFAYKSRIDINYDSVFSYDINFKRTIAVIVCCVAIPIFIWILDSKYSIVMRALTSFKQHKNKLLVYFGFIILSVLIAVAVDILLNILISTRHEVFCFVNYHHIAFLSAFFILLFWFVYSIKSKSASVEKMFVVVSLAIGIAMIFTSPVGQTNVDLDSHYKIVVSMASPEGAATQADQCIVDRMYSDSDFTNEPRAGSIYNFNKEEFFNINNQDYIQSYSSKFEISELNSACVLAVCRFFDIPFCATMYLICLFNLSLYVLIFYFGIRQLKSGKIILLVIALFPANLFAATTITYDWWVIAFISVGCALFFSELQQPEKPISTSRSILMYGMIFLGCLPKQIYFLFLLLPFFLSKGKFKLFSKNLRKHQIIGLIFVLFLLLSFGVRAFFDVNSGGDIRGGTNINPIGQIIYIFQNPISFTVSLTSFMGTFVSASTINDFICRMGLFGLSKYSSFYVILLFAAIFTDKNTHDKHTHKTIIKLIIYLFFIISSVLIALALYVSYNDVGSSNFNGVQARYLVPILFPVAAILGTHKIKNFVKNCTYVNVFSILCSAFLVVSVFQKMFMMWL